MRSDAWVRAGIRSTAADPVDVPEELIAGVRGIPYGAFRAVLRENGAYITERTVPERLAPLGIPVLVIFGAADPRWDPASAQSYAPVPTARVEMLPGVGHLPLLEAPEATGELLLDFVATARQPRS